MSELDLNAAAAALYGSPAPKPVQAAAPAAPMDLDQARTKLYGEPDGHVDPDTGIDRVYHAVQADIVRAGVERLGISEAEATDSSQVWAEVFRDADITTSEANTLVEIGVSALANGVDEGTFHQWSLDAQTLLRTEFGATYEMALKDARAYVARHPKLAAYLDETGLGNHPKVVLAAAKKGRALRAAGKH